ncbi:ArsR/SmtB family transcription factor [Pseudooceanicola onchidii]|uniref:ArsR/SmtB family transcription factor n=1 Tax=Pseudooceanicola onchidii TaxID=2562279 RepID=UPI0010AA6DA2|nr:winged helix-turn-helix domain-containing protein [Pseudooceanicola onchidii]
MRNGPDISEVAALIGDPGRAHMLLALLDGRALSAGELAGEAGVTLQTASGHLARMVEAGLLCVEKQGRHRYFRLATAEVAEALSALLALADQGARRRVRTGPRDAAMRKARSCYNHLAGEMAVRAYDSLRQRGLIVVAQDGLDLSDAGHAAFAGLGVALTGSRKPLCRECLDWSERRMHLSGPLGTGLLTMVLDRGWARRETGSRVVAFTQTGEAAFRKAFPLTGDV